jgi:hypothetical protein
VRGEGLNTRPPGHRLYNSISDTGMYLPCEGDTILNTRSPSHRLFNSMSHMGMYLPCEGETHRGTAYCYEVYWAAYPAVIMPSHSTFPYSSGFLENRPRVEPVGVNKYHRHYHPGSSIAPTSHIFITSLIRRRYFRKF